MKFRDLLHLSRWLGKKPVHRPRGVCVCGKTVSLKKDGTPIKHKNCNPIVEVEPNIFPAEDYIGGANGAPNL